MSTPDGISAGVKRVELLATMGVFVLGVGAGTWLSAALANYVWVLLVGGGLMHAVGMYGKHRMEIAHGVRPPWWYRLLYWLCWGLLAVLAILILLVETR